jgi:D-serine deaminase-like pyridoxal phosphate-dependent protein
MAVTNAMRSCVLWLFGVVAWAQIHPGNYCLYDRQQVASGSCTLDQVACYVITRVIGVYPLRNSLLIDAGRVLREIDGVAVP